jgi:hypothetical protein
MQPQYRVLTSEEIHNSLYGAKLRLDMAAGHASTVLKNLRFGLWSSYEQDNRYRSELTREEFIVEQGKLAIKACQAFLDELKNTIIKIESEKE